MTKHTTNLQQRLSLLHQGATYKVRTTLSTRQYTLECCHVVWLQSTNDASINVPAVILRTCKTDGSLHVVPLDWFEQHSQFVHD